MSATPASTLTDSEQLIADLQRRLDECRAERDEALEYQTATSDVLKVISRSKPMYNRYWTQWPKRRPGFAAPISERS
jgi:hypothetical protein